MMNKAKEKYFQSNKEVKKSMNAKIAGLVKKLIVCIKKDLELDEMTLIELEAMGFKLYPPTSYPQR